MTRTLNPPKPRDWARDVGRFETELEEYPDDTGAILLDLAHALRCAGASTRAVEVLEGVVAAGREDGEYARAGLAEVWFELDQPQRAYAVLDELRRVGRDAGPREVVAELLVERGESAAALRWYNLAAAEIDATRASLLDLVVLRGRCAVRRELGLAPDILDELTAELETGLAELIPTPAPLLSPHQALEENATSGAAVVRVLVLQRAERVAAIIEFGSCFGELPFDFAAANGELEAGLREMARRGTGRVDLVLGMAASLRSFLDEHGGDATDDELRARYLEQRWAEGATISWPPPRNGPCWCGSGTKYKKCCRRGT